MLGMYVFWVFYCLKLHHRQRALIESCRIEKRNQGIDSSSEMDREDERRIDTCLENRIIIFF